MIKKEMMEEANRASQELARRLSQNKLRIVFAESCTAGLVSALMAGVPGISNWMCGSAATYRDDTKCKWLDIDPELIRQHSAVSDVVTRQMAERILIKTPEADIAVAITGHLELEVNANAGSCFVAAAIRSNANVKVLGTDTAAISLAGDGRVSRQWNAAIHAIKLAIGVVSP